MASNQFCGKFCDKNIQPPEWNQHCSGRRHHVISVNLRPRPQNHPCCGRNHEKSQCRYRANLGNLLIGPEHVTTRNSYARRQLSEPPMEQFVESIRNLFDEDECYLEAIRHLFDEEGEREAARREEPIAEQPHTHYWWEAFKAGPYPKIRSQGKTNPSNAIKSALD
jgi:hypothetical protein